MPQRFDERLPMPLRFGREPVVYELAQVLPVAACREQPCNFIERAFDGCESYGRLVGQCARPLNRQLKHRIGAGQVTRESRLKRLGGLESPTLQDKLASLAYADRVYGHADH